MSPTSKQKHFMSKPPDAAGLQAPSTAARARWSFKRWLKALTGPPRSFAARTTTRISQQLERDGHLVTRADARLAPDLFFHRNQIPAAIQREYRCTPADVLDMRLAPDRSEPARVAE